MSRSCPSSAFKKPRRPSRSHTIGTTPKKGAKIVDSINAKVALSTKARLLANPPIQATSQGHLRKCFPSRAIDWRD